MTGPAPGEPLRVGDIVRLKKAHPCGSAEWEITRTGTDIKLKCLGCGRTLMLPRLTGEKSVRAVRRADA